MNKLALVPLVLLLFLASCASRNSQSDPNEIVSIQVLDRNGFSETISNKDRLSSYKNVDFLTAQPYQKVLRVFGKDTEGKSRSKITSYHSNGQIWQYLEVSNGRAHGIYREWHENGTLRIEATVIEGLADISEMAQASWLFEGKSSVFDEQGRPIAVISYEKGSLHGTALYYYSSGQLQKTIPYDHDKIEGSIVLYDPEGKKLEEIPFSKGFRNGSATAYWKEGVVKYRELWKEGLLFEGSYYKPDGSLVAKIEHGEGFKAVFENEKLYSLIEHHKGTLEGTVKIFSPDESLHCTYVMKEGKKHGEELEYYPCKQKGETRPKLSLFWQEDSLQGLVKTWYESGAVESEREMSNNKKHGLSFAYYKDGSLMLMEEYQNGRLMKGSYFKRGEKQPVSTIDCGSGICNLFDSEGHFLRRIEYDRGSPITE